MGGDIATKLSSSRTDLVKPGLLEYSFWGFLLVTIGRIGELIPGLSSIPIGKITLALCVVSLIANWKRFARAQGKAVALGRTAQALLWLSLVLTPFSFWRGGSVGFVLNELPVLIAVTLITYKIGYFWHNVRGTMLALVICGIGLAWSALRSYHGGRAATDTMYDTNDLAYVLVTVFPLALGFAVTARSAPHRAIYWGVTVIIATASLLTESRGGFLGLIAELLLLLFVRITPVESRGIKGAARGTGAKKIAGVFGAACIGAIIWFQLPQSARSRFDTILNLGGDYNLDQADVTGRREIWTRGIEATLRRPFGYGPHTFPMVDLKFGGHFMAPHNSFLEIMVELGLLGILLFVAIYFLALSGLQAARRDFVERDTATDLKKEQIGFARLLQISLIGNVIAGFFLSMSYSALLWTLIGLSMAIISSSVRSSEGRDVKPRNAARAAPQSRPS